MATFLQRIGREPLLKALQSDSLDEELRASLWNALIISLWDRAEEFPDKYTQSGREAIALYSTIQRLWVAYLKRPLDDFPPGPIVGDAKSVYGMLRAVVISGPWDKALDLIDALVKHAPSEWKTPMTNSLNLILQKENSGYRFVANELTPITGPSEISAIESAIASSSKAVRTHLQAALSMLADRNNPDFRNSIKESISAVEAACQAVAGSPSASLGDCLKTIKKSKDLHPAFEGALVKLYGYTSDAAGIRHALTEDGVAVTSADAQFMLVTSSAFTNYLWTVAAEANLKI